MSRGVARSKFAADIMHRLWDEARGRWVTRNGRSIWHVAGVPTVLRETMIAEGRDPATLSVEKVWVEIKN